MKSTRLQAGLGSHKVLTLLSTQPKGGVHRDEIMVYCQWSSSIGPVPRLIKSGYVKHANKPGYYSITRTGRSALRILDKK
jgi:hypothetical protein